MEQNIIIEAGKAFGSGSHPSTDMALHILEMMANLKKNEQPKQVLDIGCGSGILSIAAASMLGANIIASDIEQDAVRATEANANNNGFGRNIVAIRSDGYNSQLITQSAPYDLIICNVLAEHIIKWAKHPAPLLKNDGLILLSGILVWRREEVANTYQQEELEIVSEIRNDDWCCLLLQKGLLQIK